MGNNERLEVLIKENKGHISRRLVLENNIPSIYLTRFVKEGKLERIKNGVYVDVNYFVDELYVLCLKYPRIIYTGRTALYLNNMSNRTYKYIEANVPRNYSNNNIKEVVLYRVNENFYKVGKEYVETSFGNLVPTYNMERCICNLYLFNEFDMEQRKFAIDYYVSIGINYSLLYDYAHIFGIYDKMIGIFEVI